MWQHYRRTLIPIQLFVITMVLIMIFGAKANLPTVVAVVVSMELMSIVGTFWAMRLRRKIETARNQLPPLR